MMAPMRPPSIAAILVVAATLPGCGARAALDALGDAPSVSGSTGTGGAAATSSTSTGLGGAGPGTTTSSGAGGAGGGLFELGTFDKPTDLALDADYVYVSVKGSEKGAGQVVKLPKGGGDPIVLVPNLTATSRLVVDDTDVFFIDRLNDKYELARVSKAGGNTKSFSTLPEPCRFAVDAQRLYLAIDTDYVIRTVDKKTGFWSSVGGDQVSNDLAFPRAVVVDAAAVYWGGSLMVGKVPKPDGTAVELTAPIGNIKVMAQDSTQLYWTMTGWPDAVGSMPKEGGEITWLGEDTEAGTRPLAVRGMYVYWANDLAGTIKRVSKTGGPTTVIASGQGQPHAMAADDSGVYWANLDDGRIMRFVE
jgi:hypothetical protein